MPDHGRVRERQRWLILMCMSDDRDRYHPRWLEELAADSDISLINEPIAPDNVIALPKARSLHAVLCEALTNTRALLTRLEAGVMVPRDQQWEVVRELYVQTRATARRTGSGVAAGRAGMMT